MAKKLEISVSLLVAEQPAGVTEVLVAGEKDGDKRFVFESWKLAIQKASQVVRDYGLQSAALSFVFDGRQTDPVKIVPGEGAGGLFCSTPQLEVEKRFEQRGFVCQHLTKGEWLLRRPDPAETFTKRRGYYDFEALAGMLVMGDADVDAKLEAFWSGDRAKKSPYAAYINNTGGRNMAKAEKAAEAKTEKAARKTVKTLEGADFEISPKQEEVYADIKSRSAGGSPLGSDDERLDDPTSIAAMKLAKAGVVLRSKFGARWHYFSAQGHMDKAIKAAEAAAKKESKTPAAEAPAQQTPAATGKKKQGALKKPSEK